MRELLAKPCACDYATRNIVYFGVADRFTNTNILAHEIDRRIARFANNVENACVLFRNSFAHVSSPGLVGRDRIGFVQFCSRIDEHKIAALDR
jgi:hypothetical protein